MAEKWCPSELTLPIYIDSPMYYYCGVGEEPKKALEYYERLGITKLSDYDEYFMCAKLPEGWSISSEGYWTDVFDENDRSRFSFFKKRCPWETDGFIHQHTRYNICRDFSMDVYDDRRVIKYHVVDGDGTVLYECEPVELERAELERGSIHFWDRHKLIEKEQKTLCECWLNKEYPDWRDIYAYW